MGITSPKIEEQIISVFPNPSSNGFFNLNLKTNVTCMYELLDFTGRCLEKMKINGTHLEFPTNFSSLPNGHYLLRLIYENGSSESRIVIVSK